jgi:ATP-dependent DNA helicase RecQ
VVVKQAEEAQPDSPAKKPSPERAVSIMAPHVSQADPQLFERLRQLRTVLAEEEDVAPFLIFHDKTLKAIASHKPVTPAALLEISGIGALKAERYGRRVLQVINEEK